MSIDPKLSFYFGIWTSILLLVASGGISFDGALPAAYVPMITKWCAILGAINSTILTGMSGYSSNKAGPLTSAPSAGIPPTLVRILIAAFLLSLFLASGPGAYAQSPRARAQVADPLRQFGDKIKSDLDGANQKITQAVTPSDPKAALPCMDITVLFKLTPANLVPTMKACVQDANNQLVTDTQRALDSAKNYTKTGENTPVGDGDGVNCLTPALALFQAAAIVPAVPDILNADGSVKTKGTPEIDPGLILLFQKYREFTISGGLTSCQAWVNGPINATAAAGVAGVGAAAGAALLLPK